MNVGPYAWGAGVLVLMTMIHLAAAREKAKEIVVGADGRPSTSKLQWCLWTVVVIFVYVSVYAARAMMGHWEPITEIPRNLLISMGFSITTMAAAKGITVSYVSTGRVSKPPESKKGGIFLDDDGYPELSKVQMMAWTLIGIGMYLITVVHRISAARAAGLPPELPDIDGALMVLMGLGQGAYLGKKLATIDVPRLTGLAKASAKPNEEVKIMGQFLGDDQSGGVILVDGSPIAPAGLAWKDNEIKFTLPTNQPSGAPWTKRQRIMIGVVVSGQESATRLPFTVDSE